MRLLVALGPNELSQQVVYCCKGYSFEGSQPPIDLFHLGSVANLLRASSLGCLRKKRLWHLLALSFSLLCGGDGS